MKIIFPNGLADFHHPHVTEPSNGSPGLNRPLLALVIAAAFPVATPGARAGGRCAGAGRTRPAPSMTGPLKASLNPLQVDGGPLSPVYISGVISDLGLTQDHPFPGDDHSLVDLSNGQVIVQWTQGVVILRAGRRLFDRDARHAYFKTKHYVGDTIAAPASPYASPKRWS